MGVADMLFSGKTFMMKLELIGETAFLILFAGMSVVSLIVLWVTK